MESINHDTESVLTITIANSVDSSCYSEGLEPRICFDTNCTFPMGPMCQAYKLDCAVRNEVVGKNEREKQAKDWVEKINIENYITNYSGKPFFGGALDRDTELEEEEEQVCSDESGGDQYSESNELVLVDHPDSSDLIPNSFASDWDLHGGASPASQRASSSTTSSSKLSIRSNLSAYLEPWMADMFARTLEGQMEDSIFVGGAEDDQVLCPLCREPLGDPKYQHLLQCQYAHDERVRMERLWRR